MRLRLGELVLDPDRRLVLRGAEELHLQPKAYELLELLVRSRPRALSKLKIRGYLWPDTAVSDASLTVLVGELRAALGDDAQKPRYVRTVFGFGYALAAEVVEAGAGSGPAAGPAVVPAAGAAARVLWEKRVIPLVAGDNILGRDEGATVRIDAPGISRQHACIHLAGDEATLTDLDSKNGTYLGDADSPIAVPVPLEDGARFRLGRVLLVFRSSAEAGATRTETPGADEREREAPVIGRTLSHYRVVERLGAGGMGEVYRARDEKLQRDVALKVLPAGALSDEDARRRFRKEAQTLSRLSHPHIASLFDADSADGTDFLVMELVPGATLEEELRKGPLPEKEVVRLGTQLARGLMAAHEQGVIHRDLKPSNLGLTADGLLKVLDFGVARLERWGADAQDGGVGRPDEATATETGPSAVVGSPPYMSPEQLLGKRVDERTDLYAAGAVLYELVTGKRPFGTKRGVELHDAVLHEAPAPPREVNGGVSPGLEAVILKAMDKDPALRYQAARELLVDLERLQQGSGARGWTSTGPPSVSRPFPSRRPGRRLMIMVGAIMVIALAWLLRPLPALRITDVRPLRLDLGWLSESGHHVSTWTTDGVRLYYVARRADGYRLFQVPMAGGAPSEIEVPERLRQGFELYGFLPKQSALLCLVTAEGRLQPWPAWSIPVPSGVARPLGRLAGNSAAVSPDGERIVLAEWINPRLHIAGSDGEGARTLVATPATPAFPTWAQDSNTIRFAASGPTGQEAERWIWETTVAGEEPRPLWPGRRGDWTPDGRYFAFERWSRSASRFDLFAVLENSWPAWIRGKPRRLTNGPVSFFHIGPRSGGRGWFAFGSDRRAELQRFDRRLGRFEPFLGGQSIGYVDPSPDGEWLTWVSYPEEALWQGRRDGNESHPLTSAPLRAWMPRWSPDGKQILFVGIAPGEPGRSVRLVPAGGGPVQILAGPEKEVDLWDPCWLPDGDSIVFGRIQQDAAAPLRKLDLRTREVSVLPGSNGLHWPKCGPKGQILTIRMPAFSIVVWWPERAAWEEVGPVTGVYHTWTRDGRSFCGLSSTAVECYSFATRRYETLAPVSAARLLSWVQVPWMGLDLDGSPMVMRDVSTGDLYSLDWEAP